MKKSTFLFSSIIFATGLFAQTDNTVQVIYPTDFHIYDPADHPQTDIDPSEEHTGFVSKDKEHRVAQIFTHSAETEPEYANDESQIQRTMGTRPTSPMKLNIVGQNGGGSCPPDPSGAVGLTQYVQAVNATPYKVYNKATGVVTKTSSIGFLFTPVTVPATVPENDGDPIILYDKYADRWVLTQFGVTGNKIFIAISQTSDATGAYYVYTYTDTQFPDYLKFSIWADGYYMSSNQNTDKIFCFERTAMLAGVTTARSLKKTFTGAPSGFFAPMTADADGSLPPAGTPLPFFTYFDGTAATDGIKIWEMLVDWSSTTPTATITAKPTVLTGSFDASYDAGWDDISQNSGTQKLDGIGGILGYRAQWRAWTGYNSVVVCWPVKISTTQRSIKWAELRQIGTTWSLYQTGIYAPNVLNRWLGSIAMDDNGSISLCYAVAGPANATSTPAVTATPVSLRYTGRLASDPLGTMTFAETSAVVGSGTMTACGNRFGDYSHTSLDPDGLTFWHTGEYVASGSPATRIYSFKLPLPLGTGVENEEYATAFSVFQVDNILNFKASKLPSNEEFQLDLFDVTGKQINGKKVTPTQNAFETSINVSGLAKGTYLVRVGNINFQRVIKVLVN